MVFQFIFVWSLTYSSFNVVSTIMYVLSHLSVSDPLRRGLQEVVLGVAGDGEDGQLLALVVRGE